MTRQRPARTSVGAVAVAGALLLTLSGCGNNPVELVGPEPTGADATACAALVEALPASVADQPRREISPPTAQGGAWGPDARWPWSNDQPITLRCGVAKPAGLDEFSTCQVANGVGWYIPEEQMTGEPETIVMTTIGRAQYVQVRLPRRYWPPAAAMVDLAPAIKRTIREVKPCV